MFVHAATAMGYRVIVLDPNSSSPAGEIAHLHLQANYDDAHSLKAIAQECSAITTEFENVPAEVLAHLEKECCVHPSANAVEIAQNRIKEKQFAESLNIVPTPFHVVNNEQDIQKAFSSITPPLILKTASLGYDGKGQAIINSPEEGLEVWKKLNVVECIFEQKIDLAAEISVVVARSSTSELKFFPVAENVHRNGILHTSTVPANVDEKIQDQAKLYTRKIAETLKYCGILAVEFFIDKKDRLYFNEMAPRTHNSAHYSIDACYTSQFEQQIRAICGLPLGNSNAHSAATMTNLLGDLWNETNPDWLKILQNENVKLHLYGKKNAQPGRKMGHFCYLAAEGVDTLTMAEQLFSSL
jgi:5-(carboxyamino)imidazole ribonucleotide synthase